MVLHNPPYKPLDILLSYSHYHLQNNVFTTYLPLLVNRAKVAQIGTASPFSMGLLTPNPPPWHPATPEIMAARERAIAICHDWDGGLPNLALGFGLREGGMPNVPRVVGLTHMWEVHEAFRVWREAQNGEDVKRKEHEEAVRRVFKEAGCENLSWDSPPSS